MSDKLRDLTPVRVTFSAGEQPTAAKLNNWADQIERGFRVLESAIGDIYSDSHPLFSSGNTPAGGWGYDKTGTNLGSAQRHLQIANLARLVGPASVLNPRALTNQTVTITEEIPGGRNEFLTRYRPITNVSLTETLTGVFTTSKLNANTVVSFGDYNVDNSLGRVTYIATQSGSVGTITYDVDVSAAFAGDTYEDATFNVIPDPNQTTKCTVTGPSAGRYTITLPTATDGQTNWDETVSALTLEEDVNYSSQLTLPTNWSTEFVSGDEIPAGLVMLWDETASSFLAGQSFYYVSQTVIEVDDTVTLDTGSIRYSIVTVGADITRTLDSLRTKFYKHAHNGSDGSMPIDHNSLTGRARGYISIPEGGGGTAKNVGWTRNNSQTNNNDHPQYLHRVGSDGSDLKNAMMGNLLFAPEEYDDGTNGWAGVEKLFFDGTEGQTGFNTHAIFFGATSTGAPRIRAEYLGSTDGAVLTLRGGGSSTYTKTSNDGIVLESQRRIVLDNAGQSTYSIFLNSGRDVNLVSGEDINLTSDRTVIVDAAEEIELDTDLGIYFQHGAMSNVRVERNDVSGRGGRLAVKGDSTSYGTLTVEGKISATFASSGSIDDGEIHAVKGFCTPSAAGAGVAMFAKSTNDILGSMPDNTVVSLSTVTDLGQLRGIQIMARLQSDDLWYGPNGSGSAAYYYIYDVSANTISVYFTGSYWDTQAVVIDIVGTYNPA